jgi:pantoate--beta-alanine ligase
VELIEDKHSLRRALAAEREAGRLVGLVPTMGALHAGHLSLVDAATAGCDIVAVTIFVNPLQFGDPSDLVAYPRNLERDLELCAQRGVGVVFAPTPAEMYPRGDSSTVVEPGPLASRYEGVSRPGHFAGVATIVTKLFSLAGPCRAYFGEKDFQQLAIVRRMAEDLDLPVEVMGCPIVREADGLAMSSRNGRLSPDEWTAATVLSRSLETGKALITDKGERSGGGVGSAMLDMLACAALVRPDYAVVADPISLEPVGTITGEVRLLVAADVGPVRLIDNMAAAP